MRVFSYLNVATQIRNSNIIHKYENCFKIISSSLRFLKKLSKSFPTSTKMASVLQYSPLPFFCLFIYKIKNVFLL